MRTFLFIVAILFILVSTGFSQNHPPVAVNDTITGITGFPAYVNLLKNDFDPDGDSIYVYHTLGIQKVNDSTWKVPNDPQSFNNYNLYDSIKIIIIGSGMNMIQSPQLTWC